MRLVNEQNNKVGHIRLDKHDGGGAIGPTVATDIVEEALGVDGVDEGPVVGKTLFADGFVEAQVVEMVATGRAFGAAVETLTDGDRANDRFGAAGQAEDAEKSVDTATVGAVAAGPIGRTLTYLVKV